MKINRAIKFRIFADGKRYDKCLVGNTNDVEDDKWTCPMVWLEDKKEWVNCDNGIICQYTGLKDKNGVEIYEGDIIQQGAMKFIVEYNWHTMGFVLKPMKDYIYDYMPVNVVNNLPGEVIGNIYDELKDSDES